jgi:hypothetical protein
MSERILPHAQPNAFESRGRVPANLNPESKLFDPFIDADIPIVRCLASFIHLTTPRASGIFRSFPRHAVCSYGPIRVYSLHFDFVLRPN